MRNEGIWVFIPKKESSGGVILFGIVLLVGFAMKLEQILFNWREYTPFNKIVAGIYYFILYLPIKVIISPFYYVNLDGLTSYNNLNLTLEIISKIILCISIFFTIIIIVSFITGKLASVINKVTLPRYYIDKFQVLLVIFLGPVIIWGIVKLFVYVIGWLFS